MLEILPYIEEIALYRQYHFNLDNWNASNDFVRKSLLPIQNCPSDPLDHSVRTPDVSAPLAMTSSYKGVAGRGWYYQADPAEAYWDSYQAGAGGQDKMSLLDRGALPVVVTAPIPPTHHQVSAVLRRVL